MVEQVESLARMARQAGLDGLVTSPREVAQVREIVGPDFTLVTPGIRPAGSPAHDQARTMTPREAAEAGSDFIVVGRPISAERDPLAAAEAILLDMEGR
jgi:orotidine-5'-phosphate decarboxylase